MIRIHKQDSSVFDSPGWCVRDTVTPRMVWGPTLKMAVSTWRDWRHASWNLEKPYVCMGCRNPSTVSITVHGMADDGRPCKNDRSIQ